MAQPTYQDKQNTDNEKSEDKTIGGDSLLRSELSKQWEECQQPMRYRSLDWDLYEDLLFVQGNWNSDQNPEVSEGSLSSIVIERATRVVGQVPSGVVDAVSIQDQGKALLMNLILHYYVLPNAGEGYDFETLEWLWDLYSNTYGGMPMVVDWKSTESYTGPCAWLCPIRNYFPQQGRFDPQACDYVMISSFISREDLQDIVDSKDTNWDLDAIQEILTHTKGKAVKPSSTDNYLRNNPMMQWRRRATYTNTGLIELVTKYEKGEDGRWLTFAPDYENRVLRNITNPHQSGKIPVFMKQALPLIDDPIGLGDMERGARMQLAMDTTLNLQIDGQKLRTYPPMKIVSANVELPSIRLQPAAKMQVTQPDDVTEYQMNPSAENISQTYNFLKGALNHVLGDSTTQVSGDADQNQQGKTPTAIKAQQQSQSTRDQLDTKLFEKAHEQVLEYMVNLINTMQDKPIELYLFGDEIKQIIQQGYDDVKDMVQFKGWKKGGDINSAKSVRIKISPDKLQNEKGFRYRVDAGSSTSEEKEQQHQQLTEIMESYIGNPMAIETLLNAGGQTVDFPELFKQWLISGGLREWTNILKPMTQGTQPGQMGASAAGGGAQAGQQAQTTPKVSLTGQLEPAALQGAEAMAGLPVSGASPPAQPPTAQGTSPAYAAQPGMPQFAHPDIAQAHEHVMRTAVGGPR